MVNDTLDAVFVPAILLAKIGLYGSYSVKLPVTPRRSLGVGPSSKNVASF